MSVNVGFGKATTVYKGKRMPVAVVTIAGNRTELGLSDTARCARALDSCERLLHNVAERLSVDVDAALHAPQLHAHCRELSGMKDAQERAA